MAIHIRQATDADSASWLDLIKAVVGPDYPAAAAYDPAWAKAELGDRSGHETWVAESGGQIQAAISFLRSASAASPIAKIGRAHV